MENRLDGASLDIEQMERERLKAVFPQCFVEGRLDIDKLLNLCGEYIDNDFEKYKFEWHGKGEALKLAQRRSMGALRPCPEESVNWDTTENLYIEGDNLEVLKLLQTAYYRKVKMIYIDPPYNTGNDFVYEDDFKDPINRYKEVTSQTTKSNPETMGRFHTNWLNMIYPRLRLAANLLTDDGVIFISIDDNEIHNLRKVCDEVFGEENYIECITWNKRIPKNDKGIGNIHEYILIYAKNKEFGHEFLMRKDGLDDIYELTDKLKKSKMPIADAEKEVKKLYKKNGYDRGITLYNSLNNEYKLWGKINMSWPNADTFGPRYEVLHPKTNQPVKIPERGWRWKRETFDEAAKIINGEFTSIQELHDGSFLCGRIWFDKDERTQPSSVTFLDDVNHFLLRSVLSMKSDGGIELEKYFDGKSFFSYPKPTSLIKILLASLKTDNAVILDFFAGSCTTADAVMQLNAEDGGNRKFICVQLPEVTEELSEAYKAGYKNICEIGKERIRRAGAKVASEQKSNLFDQEGKKLDTGFKVFKLDTSNLKTWDSTPINSNDPNQIDMFMERLNGMIDTIKHDRTDNDMVYEIMLKIGIPLTYPVVEVEIGGKKAYSVGDDCLLLICLQDGLTTEIIETMASDYLPSKLVLSEKCFADDTAMANAHYILKERDIELKLV